MMSRTISLWWNQDRTEFRSGNGLSIFHGAYNIIKKAIPKAFPVDGIEGVELHLEQCLSIFRRELIPV